MSARGRPITTPIRTDEVIGSNPMEGAERGGLIRADAERRIDAAAI